MHLPQTLQTAIEKEISRFSYSDLLRAREELTERYRNSGVKGNFMATDVQRCAYIAARLPATFSVIKRVLTEVHSRAPSLNIKTLLDLGSGPGTAMWGALEVFTAIEQISLVEKDADLIKLGKRLAINSDSAVIRNAQWILQDLEQLKEVVPHDLIVLSYAVGELNPATITPLLELCWKAARQALVVIEPGTPAGFERIRAIRSQLITLGGSLIAPCPHAFACPMKDGDWCHFSERVARSALHRRLKEGALSYEDEKYSYIVVSKKPFPLPSSRILRHPQKKSGHVNLTLCTGDGLKQKIVSKRTPELYKVARKAEWGEVWNEE